MFGKAQGQKENPGLAKPSQTLRGNAIFDRRICENGERETGNWERGTRGEILPQRTQRAQRGFSDRINKIYRIETPTPNNPVNPVNDVSKTKGTGNGEI